MAGCSILDPGPTVPRRKHVRVQGHSRGAEGEVGKGGLFGLSREGAL